ncbi:MAG: MBL fold metallo-hydrolase [Desulfobacula sp.]|nr:MBL fold metallo-hydrolase [Desulfobacula sp.]
MTANNCFKVCPLASGSKGNSLFVACSNSAILVDAGLSGIEVERRLTSVDVSPQSLSCILITHEHSDHVKGAGILSRRFDIPVYISQKTYHACKGLGKINDLRFFECGIPFQIDGITISPFSISHDARDPAGLTLEFNDTKVGVATDLGIVTQLVKEHLKGSDLLYLESNHDPRMLMDGDYPWHLKQRIKGRMGHLSNFDACQLVSELLSHRLKHVILAHLSEENNCPDIAARQMSRSLNGSKVTLHVAGPDKPGTMIHI